MANITLRLHRQHDMDLIALYRADEYKFAREMKKVLIAYANGEIYEPKTFDAIEFEASYVPTSITFHISLNEKKEDEAKVITLLSCMRTGYRNSFAKAVFRSCIPYLPLIAFAKDNGLVMKKDVLNEFWKAKKSKHIEMESNSQNPPNLKDSSLVDDLSNVSTVATPLITNEQKSETNNVNKRTETIAVSAKIDVTENNVTDDILPSNVIETGQDDTDDEELSNLFAQMSSAIH